MTINDLQDVFVLCEQGIIVGVVLSAVPFLVGWIINFFLNLIIKNS